MLCFMLEHMFQRKNNDSSIELILLYHTSVQLLFFNQLKMFKYIERISCHGNQNRRLLRIVPYIMKIYIIYLLDSTENIFILFF